METDISGYVETAAAAMYQAYSIRVTADGADPVPPWESLDDDRRALWHGLITDMLDRQDRVAAVALRGWRLAAEQSAAAVFDDARCLIWSNAHGGWWRTGRHGYTLDVGQAERFTLNDAQRIVTDAVVDALDPKVKALSEIIALAPEERWDTPPQAPDGAVQLNLWHEVTGTVDHLYLPFWIGPHRAIREVWFSVYGAPVFAMPLHMHGAGPLHTICRRVDDPQPDLVDTVQS